MTTAENLQAVLEGRSELRRYEGGWGLPEPFCASLFTTKQMSRSSYLGLSRAESYAMRSIFNALQYITFDYQGDDVVLILSSAKGNVESLFDIAAEEDEYSLEGSAQRLAYVFGFVNEPIVVSNACISGVSALHLARLLLDAGCYRYAVVCGFDVQSVFVVSGFQSLKAMSANPCRPFDINRSGLNLGEAAATMVMASDDVVGEETDCLWHIGRTAVRNDAFHLTSPSKNADGAVAALTAVMDGVSPYELGFVNLHGTATMFNDQMEAVALKRTGLDVVPANGLKGYYGHTMGAAGVLETVLSMAAADQGLLPGTRGFSELGVSVPMNLSSDMREVSIPVFVKMISGFGGGNAALLASKGRRFDKVEQPTYGYTAENTDLKRLKILHSVRIEPGKVQVDDRRMVASDNDTNSFLTAIYKKYVGDYPKFYKMDLLSKLGFLASELLLQAEGEERFHQRSDRAVLLFNRSGSETADRAYLKTIESADNFFPSPSVFIYTLPNIVTGEIAIRNHYQGETAFYVLPERNTRLMDQIVSCSIDGTATKSAVCGWVDVEKEDRFCAELSLVVRS